MLKKLSILFLLSASAWCQPQRWTLFPPVALLPPVTTGGSLRSQMTVKRWEAGAVVRNAEDKAQEVLSIGDFGARCDGSGVDDSAAIQKALLAGAGKTVTVPGGADCTVAHTLWIASGTTLYGAGGRSKSSIIRRANGMYYDLIQAGVYTGTPGDPSGAGYDMGTRYGPSELGHNITITGIYFDGNAANAGQPPWEEGTTSQYRGGNIQIAYTDGVFVHDVWSNNTSNDPLWTFAVRRVQISDSEFSNSHLRDATPGSNNSRNCLTFAGTLSGSSEDTVIDAMQLTNVIVHDCDNLGISVQARTSGVTGAYGSSITMSNIVSYNNQDFGVGTEWTPGDPQSLKIANLVINGWTSTADGWGDQGHHLGLAGALQGVVNGVISNVTMQSVPVGCLAVYGGEQITITNFSARGWDAIDPGRSTGCIFVYGEGSTIQHMNVSNVQITGDGRAAAATIPFQVRDVDSLVLNNIQVEGGKWGGTSVGGGEGILISAAGGSVMANNISASKADDCGMRVASDGGTRALTISNSQFFNNGQDPTAPFRAGLILDYPVTLGSVTNSGAYDTQETHSQQYGFDFPNESTRTLNTFGLWGYGNAVATLGGNFGSNVSQIWCNALGVLTQCEISGGSAQIGPVFAVHANDGTKYLAVGAAGTVNVRDIKAQTTDSVGPDLAVNGGFVDGSAWSLTGTTGWNISGGTLNGAASSGYVAEDVGLLPHTLYSVTFTVVSCSAGTIYPATMESDGDVNGKVVPCAPGTYTQEIQTGPHANGYWGFGGSFTGSIDNASIKIGTGGTVVAGQKVEAPQVIAKGAAGTGTRTACVDSTGAIQDCGQTYMPVTGGDFSGAITAPQVGAKGPAGDWRCFIIWSGTLARWSLCGTDEAESGGNGGSNLQISAYADDGSFAGTVGIINRATQQINFFQPIEVGGVAVNPSLYMPKSGGTFSGTVQFNSTITAPNGASGSSATITCPAGQWLKSIVVSGGLTTGIVCGS